MSNLSYTLLRTANDLTNIAANSTSNQEIFTNVSLLQKILDTESALHKTVADVLMVNLEQNINNLQTQASDTLNAYNTINEAYARWVEWGLAKSKLDARLKLWNEYFFVFSSMGSLGVTVVALVLSGGFVWWLLYGMIVAAMFSSLRALGIEADTELHTLQDFLSISVAEVSSPGPLPTYELTKISSRLAAFEKFQNRLMGDMNEVMTTEAAVEIFTKWMTNENQKDFYSMLLINNNYFYAMLYLLKYAVISPSDISKFLSMDLNSERSAYILRKLKTERYVILQPFVNSLTSIVDNNITNELNSEKELNEKILEINNTIIDNNMSYISNNVMKGAGRINPNGVFSGMNYDFEISNPRNITEFNYYDENTANELLDAPSYLDNTNMIGYVIEGLVNNKQFKIDPKQIRKIKLSENNKPITAYNIISNMLNKPYMDKITDKFNTRILSTDTQISSNGLSSETKLAIQKQIKGEDYNGDYKPYLQMVIEQIYGESQDPEVYTPDSDKYLNFIQFDSPGTTKAAKHIVKNIIETDLIGDGTTTLTSANLMGKLLLNEDNSDTSGLSSYLPSDIKDVLKTNLNITKYNNIMTYNSFRVDDNVTDNNYPSNNNEKLDDLSNSYKLESMGPFLDIRESISELSHQLDKASTYIDYTGTPESIISSYRYYLGDNLFSDDNDVNNMTLQNLITTTLFSDILNSYWYFLKYGETLFSRVQSNIEINEDTEVYTRYIDDTFVYFKDNRIKFKEATYHPDSPTTHPIDGNVMYHCEKRAAFFKLTKDQIYYGHKTYYDEPQITQHIRETIIEEKVIVKMITTVIVTVVEVVTKVVGFLLGWIPGVKKAMKEIRETVTTWSEEISYEEKVVETVDEFTWSEIDTYIDTYAKNNGAYDEYSPYVWENLILGPDVEAIDIDLGGQIATLRTLNAQSAMSSTTGYEDNNGAKTEFTPMYKINWYKEGPRVYKSYALYVSDGGTELTGTDYDNYVTCYEHPGSEEIGLAYSGDQIRNNRIVYEVEKTFIPTTDKIATYINQLYADDNYLTPLSYGLNLQTQKQTNIMKSYYLYSDERVWKYIKNRVMYEGEYFKYYEATSEVNKYHKKFTKTEDTQAVYIFDNDERSPKQYYKRVPLNEYMKYNGNNESVFNIGTDFYIGSGNNFETTSLNLHDKNRELYYKLLANLYVTDHTIYIPVDLEVGDKFYEHTINDEDTNDEKHNGINSYHQIIPVYHSDSNGKYILNEFNEYVAITKDIDENIRLTNDSMLNRTQKFTKDEVLIPIYKVGDTLEGEVSNNNPVNIYQKAINDDKFHPVVSEDLYKFYQLLYYLRHCILDLPEYVNAIRSTKQWQELEYALHMSNKDNEVEK